MSDRKNKPDAGDYAEAGQQVASTASSSSKLARKLAKKLSLAPIELGLTGVEILSLLSKGKKGSKEWERAEAARAKAAAEVEAMATDPNVTQAERFIKGLADPAKTGYGIYKGVQRMRQNMADRDKSRDAYSELLDRGASEEMRKARGAIKRAKETNKQSSTAAEKSKRALLRWAAERDTEE